MVESRNIEYPLYLIPYETGYVSVADSADVEDSKPTGGETSPTYYLAVFTSFDMASVFVRDCGIDAEPRAIENGREFAWLIQNLGSPIQHVAFNPKGGAQNMTMQWSASVDQLLRDHIVIDYSPWNYPIYYIELDDGFVSVTGKSSTGKAMTAVAVFTSREQAQEFLDATQDDGTIHALPDLKTTRLFLTAVQPSVSAVAMNLAVVDGRHTAKYCMSIETVMKKYLVEDESK